jgi:uncharacterized membrane protein YfcA
MGDDPRDPDTGAPLTTDVVPLWGLALLGLGVAGVGALGGLGGAVLLVPVLVLLGVEPVQAAPLGLLTVAAGSLAAAGAQLGSGLVHQRLGVTTEIASSAGAVLGAGLAGIAPATLLVRVLGTTLIAAALLGAGRRGVRNRPQPTFAAEAAGEWPGTLAGAYRGRGGTVPYQARRLPAGLAAMGVSGLVAGLTGAGGGSIKTPAMSEVMHVPVKVAAATSSFTIGITAAAALCVFAAQGRLDVVAGGAVVAGATVGGRLGVLVQDRLDPVPVRYALAALLLVIGVVLVVRG